MLAGPAWEPGRRGETLPTRLSQKRGSGVLGASALTAAELHLLPLLSTHLTFPEIAEELFLSRNTIKWQASSNLPQARHLHPQPGHHQVP
jgi:DNA-binding NarL/FixJ family response regulator